ncbi:MAG: hypothetical protein VCA55_01350, partial [Verrucomicrobiales bacterium]
QGDLAPPAGAPAPTMKSLQEIWEKISVLQNRHELRFNEMEDQVALASASQYQAIRADIIGARSAVESMLTEHRQATEAMLTEHREATEATIAALLAENAKLKESLTATQDQNATIQQLLASLDIGLPWQTTTIDSEGDVGSYTSLSFSPSGNPAISYYDTTNRGLKFAFKAPFRGGR